jgi:putative phosphoesterase
VATTIGVISDTHIPDRGKQIHPRVIPVFCEAGVKLILHAGDISSQQILDQLQSVAPVYAVRGNRDWVALNKLPYIQKITVEGVAIGLSHGHGRWWNYLIDRVHYICFGYHKERYLPRLLAKFPDEQVIVFGHTHWSMNQEIDGKLFFNPGSSNFPEDKTVSNSVGLLYIYPEKLVRGEIVRI